MFTFLTTELDKLKSEFVTEKGELRKVSREFRNERIIRQKQAEAMKMLVKPVQNLDSEKATVILIGQHGYLTFMEEEMKHIFKALHDILQLYIKFLGDVQTNLISELSRDNSLPRQARDLVMHDINIIIKGIEKNLTDLIAGIEGMQSFSIQIQKLLERESQFQDIRGKILAERSPVGDWKRRIKAAKDELKAFEGKRPEIGTKDRKQWRSFEMLFNEGEDHSIMNTLMPILKALDAETNDILLALKEARKDFEEAQNSMAWENASLTSLDELEKSSVDERINRPLSVKVLEMPRNAGKGGFGLPKQYAEMIRRKIDEITNYYLHTLHLIEEESRQLLSQAMHKEQKETNVRELPKLPLNTSTSLRDAA